MSSINKAKAEAQKLIKQYQKLQEEAKNADTAEEAANKAVKAQKLLSQISTLQSTITKLAKQQTTGSNQSPPKEQEVKRATSFEDRIDHLEEAQKKNRTQIDQLIRAKEQLTGLLKREKEIKAMGAGGRTHDEKLQKELAHLISKKEAEHQALIQELDNVRQQARKEADLFKVQRDAARALMDKQKQLEREKLSGSSSYGGNKALLTGIVIGSVFSLLLGLIFLVPLLIQEKSVEPTTNLTPLIAKQETDKSVIKTKVMPKLKPLRRYRDQLKQGGKGPLMLKLPGGTFNMGSPNYLPYHDERPQHEITLQSFSISRYEITFEEYDNFARATGHSLPDDRGWGREKRPVINVNWHEASYYTKWLTEQTGHQYRLPSEREWEYAAKAGSETLYWWGMKPDKNNANCSICGSLWDGKKTAPVGSFKPNAFEIYDSIGNVMEWTISCLRRTYQGAPSTGNQWRGGDCSQRMVRSSSYKSYLKNLRTTKRNHFHPNTRIDTLGFRVVRVD